MKAGRGTAPVLSVCVRGLSCSKASRTSWSLCGKQDGLASSSSSLCSAKHLKSFDNWQCCLVAFELGDVLYFR